MTGGRRRTLLCGLGLLLLPVLLLWPCLFGGRTFVPYDVAAFPPASTMLTAEQRAPLLAGSNFDVTEVPIWFVPQLALARQTLLRDGELPGWNPGARSGAVLLAHGLDGLWYPPNWLCWLWADPQDGLVALAFVNFALAALLCFGLLRELGLSRLAALFGAVTFAASATAQANGHFYMRLAALVWLPGMLWALLRIHVTAGKAQLRPLAAFALCLAMGWLAGFPPYTLACTLLAGGCALWLALRRTAALGPGPGLRELLGIGVAAGLGLLLTAAHLLPVLLFFPDSARPPDPDLARVSHAVFDAYGFLGYLLPDLFGRPDLGELLPQDRSPLPLLLGRRLEHGGAPLLPNFNSTEYAVYPGALAMLLVPCGILWGGGRLRGFATLALLVLWGLAAFAPVLHWLFLLPGVKTVPPLRFLGPATLLLAWLAAAGLDGLRQRGGRLALGLAALGLAVAAGLFWAQDQFGDPGVWQRWGLHEHAAARYGHLGAPGAITPEFVRDQFLRSADGRIDYAEQGRLHALAALRPATWWWLAAALACGAFALRRRTPRLPTGLAAAAVGLAVLQLLPLREPYLAGRDLTQPAWTAVHDWLLAQDAAQAERGGFTIARAGPAGPDGDPGLPIALPPGTLQAHGIRDLQVYTFFDRWTPAPLVRLFGEASARKGYFEKNLPDDPRLGHPLLDLLGVRYLLATTELRHAGPLTGPRLHGPGGTFVVHERPSALPRAFVVPELRVLPDEDAVTAAVVDPAFAPRQAAFVAAGQPGGAPFRGEATAALRTVRFTHDRPNRVELQIGDGPEGVLVLADAWLPGWTAQLADGTALPILRADAGLRALRLPPGSQRVTFRYRAPGLVPGLLLSALALLALLTLPWLARRRQPPAAAAG